MNLELTEEEAAALLKELDGDRAKFCRMNGQ
jgi:hypothetical protein